MRRACARRLCRVSNADIIVLYKEFPHTDVVEHAEDLLCRIERPAASR
jgi:microcystin degradation protein MlrC